jgi:hypothetical protein
MTGPAGRLKNSALVGALAAVVTLAGAACGPAFYEIPIETPIQPKLDVTPFQRILVAGFVAGGTDEVDANQETVRLLRSQLRTKGEMRVIDADALALADVAQDQNKVAAQPTRPGESGASLPASPDSQPLPLPAEIKDEKDLEAYERLFANTAYWRQIGEEYQNPLIVTGTVLFTPQQTSGFVTRSQEGWDNLGRRTTQPVRVWMERKGFILNTKFIFIDGRTGATLHSEAFREERLYEARQNTPALSSYFELMDSLVPSFLGTLSTQKIRGTRVLLR